MKKTIKIIYIVVAVFFSTPSFAQPFSDEIEAFKKQDALHKPPASAILFVGSSSFRKWTDISSYFPGYPIINRGFGGSSLPDVTRYASEIIFPYHPKQIVIYCGDNDLASSDAITADSVFERFRTLFELIRTNMPGEDIVYVSIKPSPSRIQLFEKMKKANLLIKTYLSINSHTAFVDVFDKMLNPDGTIMSDIFLDDKLHMNAKGYAIWKSAIEPYLSK
jgi:lysophospholipase L1-like esterase